MGEEVEGRERMGEGGTAVMAAEDSNCDIL